MKKLLMLLLCAVFMMGMSSICWAAGEEYPQLDPELNYLIGKYKLVRVYPDKYGYYLIDPSNVGSVLKLDYNGGCSNQDINGNTGDQFFSELSLSVIETPANSKFQIGDDVIISIRMKPYRYKGYPVAMEPYGASTVYLSGSQGSILVRRCEPDFDDNFNMIEKDGEKLFEIVRINDFDVVQ